MADSLPDHNPDCLIDNLGAGKAGRPATGVNATLAYNVAKEYPASTFILVPKMRAPMSTSVRRPSFTPPPRVHPLALWAPLAVAVALAVSFASAVAAAPGPNARAPQQQTAEPALPAPTLTAQPAAAAVELRWTEMPGAARYELWLWKNEETGWQLVSDTLTGAAFTHTETTPGATCYYAVRALDDAGEPVSAWSQNVPATIPAVSADQPQLSASTPTPTATSTPAPRQTRSESTAAAPQLTAQPAAGAVELRWPEIPGAARY